MDLFIIPEYRSCTAQASSWSDFFVGAISCLHDPTLSSPLSSVHFLAFALLIYWGALLALRVALHGGRAKFADSQIFLLFASAHNAALALASLVMLVGISGALVDVSLGAGGVRATLCTPVGERMPVALEKWMYVFYASKFYEFLDTILLVLRGRPVTLLHLWHHSSVAVETRMWLDYGMTLGAYGMWFNSLIHVVMYSYYFCALLKIRFPFKRLITVTQIVQFLTSFFFIFPFVRYSKNGGCTGSIALFFSAFVNGSYLILFLRFYLATYAKGTSAEKKE